MTLCLFGGIFHIVFTIVDFSHNIVTQTLRAIVRMRHRFYPFGIHSLNAFNHFENIVQFALHAFSLLVIEFKVTEVGNSTNVFKSQSHS